MEQPETPPSKSLSHASEIARTIEEDLLVGRLSPGDRLDERSLAERFGVSRTPVREALQRLSVSQVVRLQARQGASIMQLSIPELLDAFIVIAELEALAAGLAARRFGPEMRTELIVAHEACGAATSDGDQIAFNDANQRFHAAIAAASQNQTLQTQIRQVQLRTSPYRRRLTFQPGRMEISVDEHQAVLDAILSADAEGASAKMRRHVNLLAQDAADFIHTLRHSFTFAG